MSNRSTSLPSQETSRLPGLLPGTPAARAVLAATAPLGALCHLVWSLSVPYDTTDDRAASLATMLDRPGAAELSILTQVLYGVVGVLGMLVLGAVVRRGAPVLGGVATVIGVLGASVGWAAMAPAVILGAGEAGIEPNRILEIADQVDALASSIVTSALFIGIPLGYLLLGVAAVAASRRGAVPRWAAIALVISIPAVLAGGFLARPFLAAGWALVVVGTAAVAWEYPRPFPARTT